MIRGALCNADSIRAHPACRKQPIPADSTTLDVTVVSTRLSLYSMPFDNLKGRQICRDTVEALLLSP
jgi:hypothetical protein